MDLKPSSQYNALLIESVTPWATTRLQSVARSYWRTALSTALPYFSMAKELLEPKRRINKMLHGVAVARLFGINIFAATGEMNVLSKNKTVE